MPTSADFDAAIAAVSTAVDAGFAAQTTLVTTETGLIVAALQAAQSAGTGVSQEQIDAVTALGTKLASGFAAASASIQSELPQPSA